MQHAEQARQNKSKKSLLRTGLRLMLAAIIIPLAASLLLFFGFVSRQMRTQAEHMTQYYTDQLVNSTTDALSQAQSIIYFTLGSDTVQSVMHSSQNPVGTQAELVQQEIGRATLFNAAWDDQYVHSIFLFRQDGIAFPASRSGIYQAEYGRLETVFRLFPDRNSTQSLIALANNAEYSYMVVDYNSLNDPARCLGKLILEVDTAALIDAAPLQSVYPGAEVMLSDAQGNLLYAASDRLVGDLLVDLRTLDGTSNGVSQAIHWADGDYLHCRAAVGDMILDVCVPQREILTGVHTTAAWYVLLTSLIFIGVLISAIYAYRGLLRPFAHTQQTLDRMAEGDLSVRMDAPEYQELAGMADTFNRMADTLTDLYQDAYKKGVLLRESEFKMLEAQINPHFIFNVLQVINLRCMEAGQKETSRMVTDLAGLLHGTIGKNGAPKVTFRQELAYVRYYLDLQKARFENALQYEIDYADSSILDYYLPKLTIQPLVENSVVHGLEPKRGGGKVSVKIWEEDDSVYIRVEDDGVGFLQGAVSPGAHNHIALDNIRKRLELMYGTHGTFRMSSMPGTGTVVLIIIPIDKTEGEHDVQRTSGGQ
ncbi:sensor histidine kinase [Butyricicoccus pullicaecorum]|uniref:HAMP domain-containing protein n=1 Tax=Butyricicoccus pullicaecorum 1.2 TaxID=1203606 RepID=R8VWS0_9FIRM|nr:sensor histidine kinase [Butyricicoccus pullicaecorum]EOQ35367.1 hypothetical protein HMPREF1526_02828 [Butyricicoccus pullicaecorum 1.2]SKA65842.1 HAMP domain-containing protein [Butyricicoccus pullicaecorum DSM 23266]